MLGRRICRECGGNFNVRDIDEGGFIMPPTLPDPPCACDQYVNWMRREDDTEDVIERRIADFHSETNPVVDLYKSAGKLLHFIPLKGVEDMPLLVSMVTKYCQKSCP
mmetsp:Transcript_6279/g.13114  ORF Transcript_6279/g.13114 Transcript_6279/m.13114 type:complete len:107 (-) Transcript_6279:89-409(-)